MSTDRLRLFVAVPIPEAQLEVLDRAVEPLRMRLPDARWAALANQHITLKFLGWTEARLFDEVRSVVNDVAAEYAPAPVSLAGLGAFPSPRRARVVWAGIDDPGGLLRALASSLDDHLARLGFEPEKRAYTPHLTLARIKHPKAVNLDSISVVTDPWPAATIELFRSHLSPRGARYEVLSSESLGPGGDQKE